MTTFSELLDRRKHVLRGLRLYYDEPFHPVRGDGQWLFDEQGRRFLDAYNNVPHVGHGHPDVVAALCRQAGALNTNTRYLYEPIVEYAERLVATMPVGLDAVMFACTGSEANDLAWRLARNFTGNSGAITTHNGYHGNTTFLDSIDGSSVKLGRPAAHWWATVPAPPDASDHHSSDAPGAFVDFYGRAVEALAVGGHRPAALFLESFFCTDGVRLAVPGLLSAAVERVRSAGGLVIADEVQAGLGRSGTHMWSFERLGLSPDIVVMGKPMGNGHPIAIVVARHEIVDAFYAKDRYFNTFAGNPVSCAVGLAVLDAMEKQSLREHAHQIGTGMKQRLLALIANHPLIGNVRGQGLLLGVELVEPGPQRRPASKAARWVINDLVRRGVLVGLTGPDRTARNILKIRPPMVFDGAAVDLLVGSLDRALSDCARAMPAG